MADLRELVEPRPLGDGVGDLGDAEPGGSEARRRHDVARPVREQDRSANRARERLEVHLLHREACMPHGVRRVLADDRADHLEDARVVLDEVGADRLDRDQIGELVEREPLGQHAPVPEHRSPVDVAAGHPAVGARGNGLLGVLGGERDPDHAAHGGAVDERLLDAERVEEAGALVGPALDRVVLDRAVGATVAGRVVREQTEVLAKAVVHHREVVAAEQRATELEDQRLVLGPGELVVDAVVVHGRIRHRNLLLFVLNPRSGRRRRAGLRR